MTLLALFVYGLSVPDVGTLVIFGIFGWILHKLYREATKHE